MIRRTVTLGVAVLSLLAVGLSLIEVNASATATLPTTINEVVSPSASLTDGGCPSFSAVHPTPSVYGNLASAVTAATNNQTIYVCAGAYDLSTSAYGSGEDVVINKALTIDGYNWNVAPTAGETPDPTTQSEFENGSGFLVESSNVTISGLTFYENNFNNPDVGNCNGQPCGSAIDVQSLITGAGDQGEPGVTIQNNFFDNTGGGFQNGVVHFGLGQDGSDADVTALDANDVVEDNYFTYVQGFENNAVQMSDTTGALVTENVVTYPTNNSSGQDDGGLSALWFPGFNQSLTVSDNTLNGGGIDSDSSAAPDIDDPKSGVKIIDEDLNGVYGSGCSNQDITGNTISGFVYDISLIGNNINDDPSLCPAGPTNFSVTDNTLSNPRIYGIYVSSDATDGTINNNVVSDADSEGYTGFNPNYTAGEYDYYAAFGTGNTMTWVDDSGNGSSYPSSINEVSTTTTTTTTTTIPPPPPPTTTTTTTTTLPPTTTTTSLPKPSVTVSAVKLGPGNRVLETLQCSAANCSGIIELTKTVNGKTELLGKVTYNLARGNRHLFSVQLNPRGLKLLRESSGHHFICELTVTSAGGVKHQNVSI